MQKKRPAGLSEESFNKYVKPVINREKKVKADSRRKWWAANWIGIAALIIAFLALLVSIGSLAVSIHALKIG